MPEQVPFGVGKEYRVVSKPEKADLERIRARILEGLLTSTVDEERVLELRQTIRADGSWPGINYEDVSRTGFEHRKHVSNLFDLSLAYAKPGSKYAKDPEVMKTILSGMDFWTANDFIADNWHTNEIGNPTQWVRILLLLDDALPQEQATALVRLAGRANLEAWGARPGGDRIKIAGIMAELAVYKRDEEALKRAVQAMAGEIKLSKGRGVQPDLSFHHRDDRVTSTLSYGTGYAGAFADWAARLAGTPFAFPAESLELLIDFYLDGVCQTMVHGWYKDPGAINRSMSRPGSLQPIGPEILEKLSAASEYRRKELDNIALIRKGEKAPDLSRTRFFWHSEYFSHQRPGYFASVRMFSDRNRNMEFPHNEESLRHHHYADGSNFLSRTGTEYYDIFPVWDWQKIPGTTVVQKPSLPHWREIVQRGKTNFVGGLSDDRYGLAAFDFASPHDPLTARKAWFFFDEEYVCLGAGIRSDSEYPVATTLNQTLLRPSPVVKTAAGASAIDRGESSKIEGVEWVFHDEVAYIFLQPVAVNLRNQPHRGRWSDITNHSGRALEEEVEKDLFAIWLDHGLGPQDASYEYVVKPAIGLAGVESFVKGLQVKMLVNTPEVQAVRHEGLNLTQVVFYEPSTVEIAAGIFLTVEDPGLVMVKMSGPEIDKITVSDPTRELRTYRLSVTARFQGEGYNWKALWYKSANYSTVDIELPAGDEAGRSAVLEGNVDGVTGATERRSNRSGRRGRTGDTSMRTGSHFVGESYGGGIVIWVDETGEHGLIAATADQHDNAAWRKGPAKAPQHFGDHRDGVTGARGDGIGAGQENTRLIQSQPVEEAARTFAAKECSDCRLGEYDDWYLPSRTELQLIYEHKDKVGGFGPDLYWSSTEYNVGFAWMQSFNVYGNEYTSTKGTRARVRCVRRF